jgi:hypothetical protein
MSKLMRLMTIVAMASIFVATLDAAQENKNAPAPKADPNAAKIAKLKSELAAAEAALKKEQSRNITKDIESDPAYRSFMAQSQRALSASEAKRLGNLPGGEAYKRAEAIKAEHAENITRLKNQISALNAQIAALSKK